MDCPTCAGKVERALSRVKGVEDIDLRPTMGRVDVTLHDIEVEEVVAAIEAAGYPVEGRADDQDRYSRPPVWQTRRAVATGLGAIFVALGGTITFGLPTVNVELIAIEWWVLSTAQLAFLTATLIAGTPIVGDGYYSAKQHNLDIDLLMSVAIIAAVLASLPFESAMLAVLYSIAELLERHSMDRARSSVQELLDLSPTVATRLTLSDTEETVPVEVLEVGDTIAVRPGERIPADGTVIEGASAVDQSPITGESVPVDVDPGSEVFAGTINEDGYLEIRVDSEAGDTTLSRIIELVEDAETGQTDYEQYVDRFAGYYTPTVVVLAILVAIGPPAIVGAEWGTWFLRGLTLLVIACPCAFVISTPVSVVSGITSAARNGVLIKGGRHLEAMADVDVVAFDKTGTLTTGELSVTDVRGLDVESDQIMGRAAALEAASSHPIAEAITQYASSKDIEVPKATAVQSNPGRGVTAIIDGTSFHIGSPGYFRQLGFDLSDLWYRTDGGQCAKPIEECSHDSCENLAADVLETLEAEGKTVVLLGTSDRIEGLIAISDTVREEAATAVSSIREAGVRTVLLTGDNEGAARTVAQTVGIDEYHAELLPEEKLTHIESIQDSEGSVAMVGDGVNDAPALTLATVGVAMGAAGTDAAIEASDIALMGDDLGHIPYLHRLSRTAEGVIRQNILSSLAVKAILAIGAPFGVVTVVHAVLIGDMGMSLGVTGNAMRLARLRP